MFKKIALIFLSSLLFLNSMMVPLSALAADEEPSTWYNQGFTDWYSKVYGDESPPSEIFGERYTAAQVQWILYSLFAFPVNFLGSKMQSITSCAFAAMSGGLNIMEDIKCASSITEFITNIHTVFGIATKTGSSSTPNLSFFEAVTKDYNQRPLSGIKYLSDQTHKFMSVPEANAQGFGYSAVSGLQEYWRGFRDIAYAITVLVVIIFSFMIMFRVKLSPQLVISVQSALPKVFGALILATFSYAIAGFVIDLSYVVGGLFASLMEVAKIQDFQTAFNVILPIDSTSNKIGSFYALLFMAYYSIYFFIAALLSVGTAVLASGGIGSTIASTIVGILATITTIFILCLMLWYAIKIPIVLIKNLVSLLVSIIIAPIQIVLGSLVPSIGFGMWFKKIIAEALVFPVTGLFMFLALITVRNSIDVALALGPIGTNAPTLWSPPILGSADKLAGIIWIAISFTFITMLPKVVDIMKMLIMGAKFDFGTAMGEAVGVGKTISSGATAKIAGNVEQGLATAASQTNSTYVTPGWIQALRTTGFIKK